MASMHSSVRSQKIVVAALIRNQEGAILLTRRPLGKPMPGFWEFPGGKVEFGEHPEEALCRELQEELGVSAQVKALYDVIFYPYPEFDLWMLVYHCKIGGVPRAVEVAEIQWVAIDHLSKFQVLPADEPIIERLRQNG